MSGEYLDLVGSGDYLDPTSLTLAALRVNGPITGAGGGTLSFNTNVWVSSAGFQALDGNVGFAGPFNTGQVTMPATNTLDFLVGGAPSLRYRRTGFQTTDATNQDRTDSQYASATGDTILAKLRGTCKNTAASTNKSFEYIATWRNIAGTLTIAGAATTVHNAGDAGIAAAAFAFVASGVNLVPRFNGIAAQTIEWDVTVEYIVGS